MRLALKFLVTISLAVALSGFLGCGGDGDGTGRGGDRDVTGGGGDGDGTGGGGDGDGTSNGRSDPCADCLETRCSRELQRCSSNWECVKLAECVADCQTESCVENCVNAYYGGGEDLVNLLECGNSRCASECG